jgi:tetratricopeptide (TPR) repeat protein
VKKIIATIILPVFLNSYEVSDDIFAQLSETKKLIEDNRLVKARESLDYMLEWFIQDLNPLEIDLIRYFQGEIYILNDKKSLAISSFTAILKSKLLEKSVLDEVAVKLARLYLEKGNPRTTLEILKEQESTSEIIVIKYFAYKKLSDFENAFNNLDLILKENPQNLNLWTEYIDLYIRMGKEQKDLDISFLLDDLNENSDFFSFYQLFKENRMVYQMATLLKKSYDIGFDIDDELLDTALAIFIKLMDYNKARDLIIAILKKNPDTPLKYRLKLVQIDIKIGEFDEALQILSEIEKKRPRGEVYIYRGDIHFLQEKYEKARHEYFKAYKFFNTKQIAIFKLENIKKFL